MVSLSHVAVPFPPDDPLYGEGPPATQDLVFLGDMAVTGERGLVGIPADWLLPQRYNPFYPYLQIRVLHWIDANGAGVGDYLKAGSTCAYTKQTLDHPAQKLRSRLDAPQAP